MSWTIAEVDEGLEQVRLLRRTDLYAAYEKGTALLQVSLDISHPKGVARAHYECAACLAMQGRFDDARAHLLKSLDIGPQEESSSHRRNVYVGLGVISKNAGDPATAESYYLKVATANILDDATALANNNIAALYYDKGDFVRAAHHINRALEAATFRGEARERVRAVLGLAFLHAELQSDFETIQLLKTELANVDKTEIDLQCQLLTPLVNSYIEVGDLTSATDALLEVKQLAAKLNNGFMIEQVRACECAVLRAKGEFSAAINILENALETTNYPECRLDALVQLTSAYNCVGRFDETISISTTFEQEKLRRRELLKVQLNRANAFASIGRLADAIFMFQLYSATEKSLQLEQARFKVSSLNVLLRVQELANEAKLGQLQAQILEERLQLTTSALVTQTELLANFRDEIRAAVRKLPPTEPVVKELKEKLKALPCESVDWERFDAQFKAAHPEFVKNLTTTHTDLTSMEVRICSLLRSSLKSQDIGRLLCLSDRTVENHRFNIRRKLALARSVDLKVYLQRF